MKPTTAKMTYDQYCLLPEDRNQYELFDGELVMTPSPTRQHQEIVGKLFRRLAAHVEAHRDPVARQLVEPVVLKLKHLAVERSHAAEFKAPPEQVLAQLLVARVVAK